MITDVNKIPIYHEPSASRLVEEISRHFVEEVKVSAVRNSLGFSQKYTLIDGTFLVVTTYRLTVTARVISAREAVEMADVTPPAEKEKHFDLLHPQGTSGPLAAYEYLSGETRAPVSIWSTRWAIARLPDYPKHWIVASVLRGILPANAISIRARSHEIRADDVESCRVPCAVRIEE